MFLKNEAGDFFAIFGQVVKADTALIDEVYFSGDVSQSDQFVVFGDVANDEVFLDKALFFGGRKRRIDR